MTPGHADTQRLHPVSKYALSRRFIALALSTGLFAMTAQADGAERLPAAVWPENERVRQVLAPTTDFSRAEAHEVLQGGAGTQRDVFDRHAHAQASGTLDAASRQRFSLGQALFDKFWVASPASTLASDGLGPFYNGRACQSCHIRAGRGQLPVAGDKASSLLIQLQRDLDGQRGADPNYGSQFHALAVPGVPAEGQVRITTTPWVREFADGHRVTLQKPTYSLSELAYGPLDPATRLSPRIAPALLGLGLLEAIDPAHILAYADPEDHDGDGISGRANWQLTPRGERRLGRFAHKAAAASVKGQNVMALFADMGLSTSVPGFDHPQGDCTAAQSVCASLAHGEQGHLGKGEATDEVLELITFYTRNLAVPARRDVDQPQVLHGKRLFHESGCQSCHVPKHVTSREAGQPDMRFQLIWPYTDLLLHDMGEALADHAADGEADGREWRTAPLWGIGLAQRVNPDARFLHDGRAATLLEAILWHGGEASAALDAVLVMNVDERAALIRFLESL